MEIMPRPRPERPYAGSLIGRNLKKLVDLQAEGSVNAWALKRRLPQATINRIIIGTNDATTGMLEKIASVTEYQAWQLLLPNFEPTAMPPMMNGRAMRIAAIYASLTDELDRAKMEAMAEIFGTNGIAAPAEPAAPAAKRAPARGR